MTTRKNKLTALKLNMLSLRSRARTRPVSFKGFLESLREYYLCESFSTCFGCFSSHSSKHFPLWECTSKNAPNMRARVVYSLLFVTVLVVFSESFCFASSTTTKNTAVSQALQRGRRRYLLEEKPTASDARIHLHRSLFIPPKEGEEEKEKGEKDQACR